MLFAWTRRTALGVAVAMLDRVRIPEAERRIDHYPFEFSGGMRQRAMIAMALLCQPELLIADEPTTALDVTVQAQILELMAELKQDARAALVLITHDLGVIARLCDRVLVMYAGTLVEQAPVIELFRRPAHPYTQRLLECDPARASDGLLPTIAGQVPNLANPPEDAYIPRQPFAGKQPQL